MSSKYEFYEIVKVISDKEDLKNFYGVEAPIMGKSEEDDGSCSGYSIKILNECWCVDEEDIESTGKFANPDDFKPVGTIRVRVEPDGTGEIIDD